MAIILDLETAPIDGVEALVEPVEAAANLRDPEKIAADIARKQAAQVDRAALYAYTARIVALGVVEAGGHEAVHLCRTEPEEIYALTAFWAVAQAEAKFTHPIVTFNGRVFDLPVLLVRSLLLGVPHPDISLDRYRSPHIDLLDLLTYHGTIAARSLKWYAKRFGIAVEDQTSGKDIAQLVQAGDWTAVQAHCLSDIRLTRALAERLGVKV
jgi:predicted PolB exonuclease-like 3'-5' exonuclease